MAAKPIKDQAAILADNPSAYGFEAVVVLEDRTVLYQGNMETAERVMTCWNVQLGVDLRQVRRYQPSIFRTPFED